MVLELVFLQNFLINSMIVDVAGKITDEKNKHVWIMCLFLAMLSAFLPFFNITSFANIILKICCVFLLAIFLSSGKKIKEFIKTVIVLCLTTFVFGGAIQFLQQSVGSLTFCSIIITIFAVFVVVKQVVKSIYKKKIVNNFSSVVKIVDGKFETLEKGYFDSGNMLFDPISNQPISLISQDAFAKLYGFDLLSVFVKKFDESKLKNPHYVNINSASGGNKIFVFCVDKLVVEYNGKERIFENAWLGLSFSGFSKALNSSVLLHSSQMIG